MTESRSLRRREKKGCISGTVGVVVTDTTVPLDPRMEEGVCIFKKTNKTRKLNLSNKGGNRKMFPNVDFGLKGWKKSPSVHSKKKGKKKKGGETLRGPSSKK